MQRVHEGDHVAGQCRGLGIAWGCRRQEAGLPVTTYVGHQHPVAFCRQGGCNLFEAVNVIRPAMQQDHHRAVGRALLYVGHIEHASVDVFQRAEVIRRCGGWLGLLWCSRGHVRRQQAKRQQGTGEQRTAEAAWQGGGRVAGRHRASPWRSHRCGLMGASKDDACIADVSA
ncbi:hypothetical protein D3C77_573410 [compost metagenome]